MVEKNFRLSLIIPCYNERENLSFMYQELCQELSAYPDHEIIFIDDGSHDDSIGLIKTLALEDSKLKYISLSRNFGHQNALKAGLDQSTGDCVISMDADMQHPPRMISKLVDKWNEGFDIVYTIRKKEDGISFFKKFTSSLFYKIVNFLSETTIHEGAADFRLLDRKVVDVMKKMGENYLFIRGMVSWVGFNQTSIEYKPNYRLSGTTKYTLKKMIHFASSGITSFSTKPLKISIYLGFVIACIAFIYGLYVIYSALFTDRVIPGWSSVASSVLFIGGIQLVMIGILGEYLGKLFMENKHRPNYIIKETNLNIGS